MSQWTLGVQRVWLTMHRARSFKSSSATGVPREPLTSSIASPVPERRARVTVSRSAAGARRERCWRAAGCRTYRGA